MVSPTLVAIGELIVAIAIPVAGGFIGSIWGGGGDSEWYKKLNKPSWTPPNWAFPVVWTTLYVLMGVASFLVFQDGGFSAQAFPLGAYVIQLIFNFGWTPLFFGLHRPDIAFGWIILLLLAVVNNIYFFYTVYPLAAYLLIPLLLWVLVASSLNWYIWQYNPLQPMPPSDITAPLHGGPGGPGTPSA
jgi:benzodiazapine receptor